MTCLSSRSFWISSGGRSRFGTQARGGRRSGASFIAALSHAAARPDNAGARTVVRASAAVAVDADRGRVAVLALRRIALAPEVVRAPADRVGARAGRHRLADVELVGGLA